jgi:signal transduction histidine kinase
VSREVTPGDDPGKVADEIAHELGTALALITGYTESLRDELGSTRPDTDVGMALDGIDRGVARLRGVSDQLTLWARAHASDQQRD